VASSPFDLHEAVQVDHAAVVVSPHRCGGDRIEGPLTLLKPCFCRRDIARSIHSCHGDPDLSNLPSSLASLSHARIIAHGDADGPGDLAVYPETISMMLELQ
jgi:hypothetical protein